MVAINTSLPPSKFAAALKDSAIAALVMLALIVPLIGLRVVNAQEGLLLDTRWAWVAVWVAIVFFGRLAMHFWQGSQSVALRVGTVQTRLNDKLKPIFRFIIPLGLGFAVVMPFTPMATAHSMDVAVLVLTYIMLGWGLNIVVGLAGLLDLGYVAFYAVGAYSYALIAQHYGWSFWACLPFAGMFAAAFGVCLGFPVLRLRGDYLAIVTLGFGEIIRIILTNWTSFTGGPNGIPNIPRPLIFGLPFARTAPPGVETFHQFFSLDFDPLHRTIFFYYVIMILALITNFFTLRIRRLPVGRAWEALREDEIACRALGINPTNTKLTAFAIGAMFGGFAGAFFAARQGFISPESFTFIESAVILAIVVLGGMGSQIGVVIAAIVLIGGTEWFRELSEYRMIAFGAAMVLIMLWRPHGLLSSRMPTIRLAKGKT